MIRLRDILLEGRYGYKMGKSSRPAETLERRNWDFKSKIGYLGTGHYFYGDRETAEADSKYLGRSSSGIEEIDLDKYNLYRAEDPELFYDIIKNLTREIGLYASSGENLSEKELEEPLEEIYQIIKEDLKLPLTKKEALRIVSRFISDIQNTRPGTMLSNRLLGALGYKGIDNTDTPLDNFGVGSIIFT